MLNFLNSLFMSMNGSMLGASWEETLPTGYEWLISIFKGIDNFIVPLLIGVATIGAVYAVYLGVNLARAEDTGKREEAKKRLVWAIVGIVVIIASIALLRILRNNIGSIVS